MLNITIRDKIRNSEIRKQTRVKDMVKIKEEKWRWAGHLMCIIAIDGQEG